MHGLCRASKNTWTYFSVWPQAVMPPHRVCASCLCVWLCTMLCFSHTSHKSALIPPLLNHNMHSAHTNAAVAAGGPDKLPGRQLHWWRRWWWQRCAVSISLGVRGMCVCVHLALYNGWLVQRSTLLTTHASDCVDQRWWGKCVRVSTTNRQVGFLSTQPHICVLR